MHIKVLNNFTINNDDGTAAAKACAFENTLLSYKGFKTGIIGHYECMPSCSKAADEILTFAENFFRERGFEYVIGPMNGSTWHSYRLAEAANYQPFFMDVQTDPSYVTHFEQNGYERIATYSSTAQSVLSLDENKSRVARFEALFARKGIRIRHANVAELSKELTKVHALALQSFAGNFLYTPISLDSFLKLYEGFERVADSKFILMAEDETGTLCAFLLAVPNLLDPKRNTLVLKTVATFPGTRCKGLGTLLGEKMHEIAKKEGFTQVIHALMHDQNESTNIASDHAETIRRYSLFGKRIIA